MQFNLVRDPWIKIRFHDRVSLFDFFGLPDDSELDGTPPERFVVFRLLLAVLQAACNLEDDEELEVSEMKEMARSYLLENADDFELYDDVRPFLQYPEVVSKEKYFSSGSLMMGVCTGNATLLYESNRGVKLKPEDEAYLLLQQTILAFSGKKADSSICLLKGIEKKKVSPASPAVGKCLLHTFPIGNNFFETLKINLLTEVEVREDLHLKGGMGVPPWKRMPKQEIGEEADAYARSYFGRLLPLNRFVHLKDGNIHITSGIIYPDFKRTGIADPSVSVRVLKDKSYGAVMADTQCRPWRQMDAVLAYKGGRTHEGCALLGLRNGKYSGIWCFGIQLEEKGGDQYFSEGNGFVEEEFLFRDSMVETGFLNMYMDRMEKVEKICKRLFAAVKGYYDTVGASDVGKRQCNSAKMEFWRNCDTLGQKFVENCNSGNVDELNKCLSAFLDFSDAAYRRVCPKTGGRNLMAFVANKPFRSGIIDDCDEV